MTIRFVYIAFTFFLFASVMEAQVTSVEESQELDSSLNRQKTSLSEDVLTSNDIDAKTKDRVKDPFMIPNRVYKNVKKVSAGDEFVDESVPPQRRWSLKNYTVVGIIWNVKSPKAMIKDKSGDIHIFYINDLIANNSGKILKITSGEVVVKEERIEVKLRLNK